MINNSNAHLRLYCKEYYKVENYELAINDNESIWELHHRLELTLDGKYAHNVNELKRLGMYFNRPYFELIFLRRDEHRALHLKARERSLTNVKISNTLKGHIVTEETRNKIKSKFETIHLDWINKSEFNRKFFEHYGITNKEDISLCNKERCYYHYHKKCRWE